MKNIITSIIIGLCSFIVYIFTMMPSLYTGDSGEIATAVSVLGIAHPTGFPTYIIFAKLFSYFLPWLEFATRLNIFSALISSLTIVCLFFILRKINLNYLVAIAISFSLAFAFIFWKQAGILQPYSLTGLFFVLGFFIFLHWIETKKDKYFYLLAIICGLGIGTHLTFLLIIPFIIIFTLIKDRRLFTIKRLILFSLLFSIIIIFIYSYIPIRASQSPVFNWGNPSNKDNFIYYITQREWSHKIATRNLDSWLLVFNELKKIFSYQFTLPGFFLILFGIINTYKEKRSFFYAGISVIFFNILLLGSYGNNEDIDILWRYFVPSYLIMAIFLGIGLDKIFKYFEKNNLNILKILVIFILPVFIFCTHFNNLNRYNIFLVQKTLDNIFEVIPQNSIVLVGGDTYFGGVKYKQLVLKERKDVLVIDVQFFNRFWYKEQKKKEIEERGLLYADNIVDFVNYNKDVKVYSLFEHKPLLDISSDFFPIGLVYGYNFNIELDIEEIKIVNDKFWQNQDLDFLNSKVIDGDESLQELVMLYTSSLNNFGVYLVNHGYINDGIGYLEKSLSIRENQLALYDLVAIYEKIGLKNKVSEYTIRYNNCQQYHTRFFCIAF